MVSRFGPALSCAAWLCASAALAQSAPAQIAPAQPPASGTVAPVTVQAQAQPKVIKKQAYGFVEGYAAAPNPEIDQIGRWHDPVCVQVVGLLKPDQAGAIKARIESVAQAVGLSAPRPGCQANVEVVFTDQPQRTMDLVAQRREYLLGYYHLHLRNRLKTVTRPIQSWYVTSTIGWGGGIAGAVFATIAGSDSGVTVGVQPHDQVIDDPENVAPAGCGDAPHFTACYKSAFKNVFILADSKALEGKPLAPVADYMAMLALSQPRSLSGCNALPSVIDLLAASACPARDPPDGFTPADAAYLTALYASDPEARKSLEQSDIARRMAAILIKANAVAAASAGTAADPKSLGKER
jgi:hypothetical protein